MSFAGLTPNDPIPYHPRIHHAKRFVTRDGIGVELNGNVGGEEPAKKNASSEHSIHGIDELNGSSFWADERKRTGFEADAPDFTAADVTTFTAKCQKYNILKDAAKDEDASKLDALKKLTGWAFWNESFQDYLRLILSAAKIPLIYLTTDARADPEETIDRKNFGTTPTEYLIEATIFHGRLYDIDNPRFYRKLKLFTVNGMDWSYIKKYERSQDGRSAYLALKTQFEGTASKFTRKNRHTLLLRTLYTLDHADNTSSKTL